MDSVHYFLTLFFLKINIVCNMSRSLEGGPGADPRHTGDCVSWLAWVHLSVPSDKLEEVDGLGVLA